jgi:hypothetical protein
LIGLNASFSMEEMLLNPLTVMKSSSDEAIV